MLYASVPDGTSVAGLYQSYSFSILGIKNYMIDTITVVGEMQSFIALWN